MSTGYAEQQLRKLGIRIESGCIHEACECGWIACELVNGKYQVRWSDVVERYVPASLRKALWSSK